MFVDPVRRQGLLELRDRVTHDHQIVSLAVDVFDMVAHESFGSEAEALESSQRTFLVGGHSGDHLLDTAFKSECEDLLSELAAQSLTSHSLGEHGGPVPFYLMEPLGGAGSIRGFREYRFRDSRNILLNVEYRWEVWTYADLAVFYDGGKVFSDASDLNFSDLESGYGFGIRGHGPGGSVMRFDFAWSREGFIWHIGSGPSF